MSWFSIGLFALTFAYLGHFARANPADVSPSFSSGGSAAGVDDEIADERKLECLLKAADVKEEVARDTAKGLKEALKTIKFSRDKFSDVALKHFVAQITSESGGGAILTEKAPKSADKTGYGLIQVTGSANLEDAKRCINELDPPKGNTVTSNPEQALGNGAKDKYLPALASLCWWKKNIVENNQHLSYSQKDGDTDAVAISQIVNTGHVGGEMTGGSANSDKRNEIFKKLKGASCS